MNMHVPQTPETRAETREVMMVPRNIVSAQVGASKASCLGVEKAAAHKALVTCESQDPKEQWS